MLCKMIKLVKALLITLFYFSCLIDAHAVWNNEDSNKKLKNHKGEKVYLKDIQKSDCILIFLSPECPLCQSYTLTINQLNKSFPESRIIAVFPGKIYSNKEITAFFEKYNLEINSIVDKDYYLAKKFNASITPQAFLLSPEGKVLYSGAIDNWAPELGKKRNIITKHYLKDAVRQRIDGEMINISTTEAIGCKIQY